MSDNNILRDVLFPVLDIFTSANITQCKITVKDNFITLETKQQIPEDFDPDMFVTSLPNTTIEITFRKQELQTMVVICKQKIIRRKIRIICPNENDDTLVVSFKLDEVWNLTDGVILEIKGAFPNTNIQVELVKNDKKQLSKEKLQYMCQCQRVSASIASVLSYSLNPEFRTRCQQLLEPDEHSNLSVQEIIAEKLNKINKYK